MVNEPTQQKATTLLQGYCVIDVLQNDTLQTIQLNDSEAAKVLGINVANTPPQTVNMKETVPTHFVLPVSGGNLAPETPPAVLRIGPQNGPQPLAANSVQQVVHVVTAAKKDITYQIVLPEDIEVVNKKTLDLFLDMGCRVKISEPPATAISTRHPHIRKPFTRNKVSKKGRPKKQQIVVPEENPKGKPDKVKDVLTRPKVTRCGRVTKPPTHMEQNFDSIDILEKRDHDAVKTMPFETRPPVTASKVEFKSLPSPTRRKAAAQIHCPKCNKGFFGRPRMLRHFRQYPGHGPKARSEHVAAWNCLIEVANKMPVGSRGTKFCQEVAVFVQNLRMLAKKLFKVPSKSDDQLYRIDQTLSSIFGISEGNYILDENELYKEVNLFSYEKDKPIATPEPVVNKPEPKDNFAASITSFETESKTGFTANTDNAFDFNLACDGYTRLSYSGETGGKPPKKIHVLQNIRLDVPAKGPEPVPPPQLISENSLPNLRISDDELIMHNVDEAHVGSLLDNSMGSDEVMNVDQFVNERLKNLTESDLQLPNSSLNLDLPCLEMFQFHTT